MSGRQNPENGAILGLPILHPRYARNGTEAGSAGGKTRSRVLKHGLTVREVIAFDECAEQFEQFYHDLASALGACRRGRGTVGRAYRHLRLAAPARLPDRKRALKPGANRLDHRRS